MDLQYLHNQVTALIKNGQLEDAQRIAAQSYQLARENLPADSPDVGKIANLLASTLALQDEYEGAANLFKESLTILLKSGGENSEDHATILQNLAELMHRSGDYFGEVIWLKEIIKVYESQPEFAGKLGRYVERLGQLHETYGRYDEAEEQLLRSVKLAYQEDEIELASALESLGILYRSMKQFKAAEENLSQSLKIRRRKLGEEHLLVARSLNNLAALYEITDRNQEAESVYVASIKIKRNLGAAAQESLIRTLKNLSLLYMKLKRYQSAEECLEEAQDLCQNLPSEAQVLLATVLETRADLYQDQGKHSRSLLLYQQAFTITRGILPPNHPTYLNQQLKLGVSLVWNEQYEQAKVLLETGIRMVTQNLGHNHPMATAAADHLLRVYITQDQMDDAVNLLMDNISRAAETEGITAQAFQEKLDILVTMLKQLNDNDENDLLYRLKDIASLYVENAEHAAAQGVFSFMLDLLSPDHPLYNNTLEFLAREELAVGSYLAAERHFSQLVARMEIRSKADVHSLSNILRGEGKACMKLGRFAQARRAYERAMEIYARDFSSSTEYYLALQTDMAISHIASGNLAEGKRLLDEIYAKAAGIFRPTDVEFWHLLNTMGVQYEDLGIYDRAEQILLAAAQINDSIFSEAQYERWIAINNLGTLYMAMGKTQEAKPYLEAVCSAWKELLGEDHPDYASSLNNLANICKELKDYDKAHRLLEKALKIRMSRFGLNSAEVAQILHNLASLEMALNDYKTAELLLLQAVKIRREALGEEHIQLSRSYQNLSYLYIVQNKLEAALEMSQKEERILLAQLNQLFAVTSEKERLLILSSLHPNLGHLLGLATEIYRMFPERLPEVFSLVIKRKGLSFEVQALQQLLNFGSNSDNTNAVYEQISQIRQAIMDIQTNEANAAVPKQTSLAALEHRRETLERDLVKATAGLDLIGNLRGANFNSIARSLPADTALIEFFVVPARSSGSRYLAFVLNGSAPNKIELVDLGETTKINDAVFAWLSAVTGEDRRAVSSDEDVLSLNRDFRKAVQSSARSLVHSRTHTEANLGFDEGMLVRQRLFDPLLPYLENTSQLFIAPDGLLCSVPFAALPMNRQYYVIDQFRISYLTTGRDLLKLFSAQKSVVNPSLVIASPDYNLGIDRVENCHPNQPFGPLMHGDIEGRKVGKLLNARILFGQDATESALKESRSPATLHIATHGFFLPDQPDNPDPEPAGFMREDTKPRLFNLGLAKNPMLRSGLALAGANAWAQGVTSVENGEDGILTAEDVVNLDLQGTELAVLSACETGLGRFSVGEGVFGLRRAFGIAGARTLVMSLWKVPDNQTRQIMESFYDGLRQGIERSEALRQAQLATKKLYPDQPYFWGAFICEGNPREVSEKFFQV